MTNPHLLIVAHGSRSSAWNNAVTEFAVQADAYSREQSRFAGASACFMEHGQPSIGDAVTTISQTNTQIIAQPLFLSVSQHVRVDIPNEFSRTAQPFETPGEFLRYQINECGIILLPPPQAPELLAQNAARRIQSNLKITNNDGVIFVYYGTKSYLPAWDALAQSVIDETRRQLGDKHMTWVYAGDIVGFSPEPLANEIDETAKTCERVIILPALVAKGVIQRDLIPAAINRAKRGGQALYFDDAILPDPQLAKQFVEIASHRM